MHAHMHTTIAPSECHIAVSPVDTVRHGLVVPHDGVGLLLWGSAGALCGEANE